MGLPSAECFWPPSASQVSDTYAWAQEWSHLRLSRYSCGSRSLMLNCLPMNPFDQWRLDPSIEHGLLLIPVISDQRS